MANDNLLRIRKISAAFHRLFSLLVYLVPLLTAGFWLSFNQLPQGFKNELPVTITGPLPLTTIALALLVSMLPTGIIVYALNILRKLFHLYQQAMIFSRENVRCYRHLGYALVCWAFTKIACHSLLSLVLTYQNPPGQKMLVISVGSDELSYILMGTLVLFISWVMHEASVLENEQALTV